MKGNDMYPDTSEFVLYDLTDKERKILLQAMQIITRERLRLSLTHPDMLKFVKEGI